MAPQVKDYHVLETLLQSPRLQELRKTLGDGETLLLEGLWDAPKALIAAMASLATDKHILILTGASQEELRLYHDFAIFCDRPVVDYPAWETLPSEKIPPSPDIVGERYQVLRNIRESDTPHIIITSLQACLQQLISPELFDTLNTTIKTKTTLPFDTLLEQLAKMGYQRRAVCSDKGEYAVRGGIIDIFPVAQPEPYRIEFWGDDIESIRAFDAVSQKSTHPVDSVDLTPAQEMELIESQEDLCSLLAYLGDNALVVFDELVALEDRYANLVSMCDKPSRAFSTFDNFLQVTDPLQKLYLTETPVEELCDVQQLGGASAGGYYSQSTVMQKLGFEIFDRKLVAQRFQHPLERVTEHLLHADDDGAFSGDEILDLIAERSSNETQLHFLSATESEENTLKEKIRLKGLNISAATRFERGYLSSGFAIADSRTLVMPMTELTHRYKIRRQKQRSTYHSSPTEVYELNPGDAVVHLNNGIGKYLGTETRPNHEGIETEFMLLEYAQDAKLFVPLQQASMVSKYIGADDSTPTLHILGSSRWKKAKAQTERAVMGYASELLQIYAKRELKSGFVYKEDSDDTLLFEDEFPFVETEDQARAIADIKKDMCSDRPVDRLVCGDVGYGKTEVAMRAAFKAVVDGGKQVAVLVPTTVLAMQHYENFCERMADFPVRIGVLSRFVSLKERKETLEGVAEGSIDILIGTHRIISKDVAFKNLGLVLIDEEQRFGVKVKEHLKKLKASVDCVTLTATPIPRTLYMSLVGVRDMSVISTPPQDRLPIKTILAENSDDVMKNALLRELARDGQAYVIHNRVETIFDMATRVKKLLPKARVAVVHGQMSSDEIDLTFHAFKEGRVDILIATTIIENGIDIPNANTILIDRADRFGLADLYQLRGRVGRWNRRAYAYLIVPRMRSMTEISRKRLAALQEAGGYGGGMKLAMRDLEIRGAGDILGLEQSGHVSAVGFHLYCKLLKRTVQALQGEVPSVLTDTRIEGPINARLPEDYVNDSGLRMEIYQRLGEAFSWDDVSEIWTEIQDRFGPPPEPTKWLYHLTRLRVFAARHGLTLIKFGKTSVALEQQKGKTTTTKKVMIKPIQKPVDLETVTIATIKKAFNIK